MESAENGLHKKGWALKRGDVIPQWNKRFLICDPYTCRLLYYRDKPEFGSEIVPRGSLDLTECTVNITSGAEEEQCRFIITSRDRKQSYNLQVGDRKELKNWHHAVHLLSKLGSVREQVTRDNLEEKTKSILLRSSQKLLRGYERKASDCRDGLQKVAEQKWRAKCRLMELLKQLKKGETELQNKYGNLKMQDKELREKMHSLIQKEFFLQDEVSKSNSIQEMVVEAFYAEDKSIDRRALDVLKLCTPGPLGALCDSPRKSKIDASILYEVENTAESTYGKKKSLPTATNFREQMLKMLVLHFPSVSSHFPRSLSYLKPKKDDKKEEQPALDEKEQEEATSKLSDTERTLLFFHSYFTTVHVVQEERLIKVRTQCQSKFHKLKWITRQCDLIAREQSELKWIIGEMKRAISRLTKEGVPLGPGEIDADLGLGQVLPEKNVKDTLVPIRAHRATWSEASDVIFRLNFNRQEESERTQELEGALTLRESVREFIDTLDNTAEEELERKIRLVEAIPSRSDSRYDLGLKKQDSRRNEEKKE